MEVLKFIVSLFKEHLVKVLLLFALGGAGAVIGLIPGSQNVSNIIGEKITDVKLSIGTAASPTIVQ